MDQVRLFTLEEANGTLPVLSQLIRKLQALREKISRLEVEVDLLEIVSEQDEKEPSPAVNQKLSAYQEEVNIFYEVLDQVHALGCFLKDIDAGLVDFYSNHAGQVVYLCWKLGEKEIGFWHEIGKGFTSRQPLEEPPK
ncbi:MAG: DUF2203 domain-containing protein [Candidatus Omnitrophota bacterium]|nr:DUF2203 domain-containing protein [Candidatus Omnitrophota bacterium]